MTSPLPSQPRTIPGLQVHQWMPEWDGFEFSEDAHRRRPQPRFYLFSMSASDLRALTGIQRRRTTARSQGVLDTGIQRAHDDTRSAEIARFIRFGFPWSALSDARRRSGQYDDLKKPGWLPTSVVVNILGSGSQEKQSYGLDVRNADLVTINDIGTNSATLEFPHSFTDATWTPQRDHPIQVIDGQHRLWAFDQADEPDYELPVVAFHDLDLSWQAYLFYIINIKPKRINASLAYDLYPLLRTEDWLERFEGPGVYREARSQELTQALWATPASPWYRHINMLGERGMPQMVRQAAWIRSLMATYVKSSRGTTIGGLFGGQAGRASLPWNGAQQAAFLVFMGQKIRDAVDESDYEWAEALRDLQPFNGDVDPAFYGVHTLLNTDQGIRGLLSVTNDLCYVQAEPLGLDEWLSFRSQGSDDQAAVQEALDDLDEQSVAAFLEEVCSELASFDWRTSSAPGLPEEIRVQKAAYRGSGGYRLLRGHLLDHLRRRTGEVADLADEVNTMLGYNGS